MRGKQNRLKIYFERIRLNVKLTAPGIVESKLHVLYSLKDFVFRFGQTRTLSVEYLLKSFELTTCNFPFSLFLMLLGQTRSLCSGRRFSLNAKAASTLRVFEGSNFL